ncbi:HTH-type transcriptional regulator GltC [Clostridium saccharobutylicum]|uniref:LysR family transcriptional regulator n=1 Tax=Clostridium saccharobutylicum TaxID=169679 RepID=UPI000983A681|nr:LysR family transcriptional regulator [Clostridium saccharobutylicum]AQS09839.1 HTH-type transcriptional regulator GltC [Clostridium saccharobutylicum]MBC2438636.1 LysR family transcriptional regulator [Clostridium saccharobutylicum]NSB90955.1 DNA-binding transcriptional LysR family regulator [Clostridium saccharobutylicum]NYC27759.1 DNA-binding transcriptional LysR family regulator [Clostridium saccharobutylicum]OOM13048.1 HTH-type transcriptional regulator GltC [Clostridium saccharobutyli
MNLYHLRYFVTLAQLEHYGKAAEKLKITQPGLSHAMASLEEELGVKLFEKEGRNVILNKYGKMFFDDANKIISMVDGSVSSFQDISEGGGNISLSIIKPLAIKDIPKATRSFLDKNKGKGIDFKFYTGVTKEIVEGLKNQIYDIGFCSKMENETDIEFVPVKKQEMCAIVPYGHPLAKYKELDLKETIPYKQIIFSKSSGLRPVIDGMFEKIGEYPHVAYEIEEDSLVVGLVAQNFGIAILPKMYSIQYINVKAIPIIQPELESYFYAARMRNRYHSPAADAFFKYVCNNGL